MLKYRPCAADGCHVHVLIRGRSTHPRCPAHLYPEKAIRSNRKAAAARVVRGAACARCGAPASHADHPVPLSQGGDPLAMQPLCRPCHNAKTRIERLGL